MTEPSRSRSHLLPTSKIGAVARPCLHTTRTRNEQKKHWKPWNNIENNPPSVTTEGRSSKTNAIRLYRRQKQHARMFIAHAWGLHIPILLWRINLNGMMATKNGCVPPDFRQPKCANVIQRSWVADVIHQQESMRAAVIRVCNCTKAFLACKTHAGVRLG